MTYYEILGVKEDADDTEIYAAFRKLAKQFHPDKNKSPDAAAQFIHVREAFETLHDAEKRRVYDDMLSSRKSETSSEEDSERKQKDTTENTTKQSYTYSSTQHDSGSSYTYHSASFTGRVHFFHNPFEDMEFWNWPFILKTILSVICTVASIITVIALCQNGDHFKIALVLMLITGCAGLIAAVCCAGLSGLIIGFAAGACTGFLLSLLFITTAGNVIIGIALALAGIAVWKMLVWDRE